MEAAFSVNEIFADHMVLQRDANVSVWGTGPEGMRVSVECGGRRAEAVVSDGEWRAALPPMEAGGPYELAICSNGSRKVFRDVLLGDVWFAGGQSNMKFELWKTVDAAVEIPAANHRRIRFYDVPRRVAEEGEDSGDPAQWEVCTAENAPQFSAVAYHFSKKIHGALGVPIGIVGCNYGGTSAACWMAQECLERDPDLRVYLDEYAEALKHPDRNDLEREEAQFRKALEAYRERRAAGARGHALGELPKPPPFGPRGYRRPGGLYRTMLAGAARYAIKGFLYYQGEADAIKAGIYSKLLTALIRNWRKAWGHAELPFLFVQLPSYAFEGRRDGEEWARLREAQRIVSETVSNTAMAVAVDLGERDNIHPGDKKPVGERLALLALEHVYGQPVESAGPVLRSSRIEGDRTVLRFDHAGAGLAVKGRELAGLEIAVNGGEYAPAQGLVRESAIEIPLAENARSVSIRYGWSNDTDANLFNSRGLPARPFRLFLTADLSDSSGLDECR